jgi:hypothetical protein
MVLAANASLSVRGATLISPEVINGDIVYAGAYTAIGSRDHATAATRGRALPWLDDTLGLIPAGWALQQVTGNTGATPIPEVDLNIDDRVCKNIAVTGLAGDVGDVGRIVYAVDDGAFTLVRPTTIGFPAGIIVRWVSATNADVLFFGLATLCAMSMPFAGSYSWNLGTVRAGLATGNALTGIECTHHGRIISVYGIVAQTATDADVDLDLNLEIGGTNVTGGVIEWVAADANGAKKAGTAITAANVFHEGDLIDIEVVANTAGTANDPGAMNIYANVLLEPGT